MTTLPGLNRLLSFPFYVEQGINRPETMAEALRCQPQQINEYRLVLERLGLIEPYTRSRGYELTKLGREYTNSYAPKRNELIVRQMFRLPIMQEILMQLLLRPSHSLTATDIDELVRAFSEKNDWPPASERRGNTIRAYLRWIGQNVGALRVDRRGTVSLPIWQQDSINEAKP
jgi:Mn-dependent DtxR family transcriptional regulator